MKELKSLTLNGTTYDSFPDQSAVKSISGITPDSDGDIDLSGSGYDLKDGYGYTEDIYIAEDGTETAISGMYYKCLDYIPVKGGISYTMYGCGYALYDGEKNFISAICDTTGWNQILEFTPSASGFVRLTMNCDDISYARFCKTAEKYLEPYDYEPHPSPFFDPKIPCNVHLYGDSNSDWSWMDVPSNAWSYRLSELITSMKKVIYNHRFGGFAKKEAIKNPDDKAAYVPYILEDTGYICFCAYTDLFGVITKDVGKIDVRIDGQPYDPIVTSGNTTISFDEYGNHTIELYGVSGTNLVSSIATRKHRSFTNHAVYGSGAGGKHLSVPDGNIAIVMYAANDRNQRPGYYYEVVSDFVRQCKARGIIVYLFAPAPVNVGGETAGDYLQTMNDVIAQLPSDCISVYGELELAEMLCGQSLFYDDFHLNELGHKILYVVVASKLQLAPPLSEVLHDINIPVGGDGGYYIPDITQTEPGSLQFNWTPSKDGMPDVVPETVSLPASGDGSYTLPVATQDTLGGVKPVTKSDDMTQSVGVDADGGLWTAPGAGSGETGSEEVVLVNYTAVEPISVVNIPFDEKMMEAINNAHMICWRLTLCGDETATDTTGEGSVEFGFLCAWGLAALLKPTAGVPSAENKGWKVGNFNGYILRSPLFKKEYIASSGGATANTSNYDLCFENKASDSITVRNVVAELPIDRTDVVLRLTTSLPIGTGSRIILTAR